MPRPAEAALRAGILDRAYAARLRIRSLEDPANWTDRDRFPGEAAMAVAAQLAPPGPEQARLAAQALLLGLELLPLALPELFGEVPAAREALVASPELLGPADSEGWRGRRSRDDHRRVDYSHL